MIKTKLRRLCVISFALLTLSMIPVLKSNAEEITAVTDSSSRPKIPIYSGRQDKDEIMIFWQGDDDADGYELQVSIDGGSYNRVVFYTEPTFQYREIEKRTKTEKRSYRLSAYYADTNDFGPWSDPLVLYLYGEVQTPTLKSSGFDGSKISLSWNKIDNAQYYDLYRKVNDGKYELLKTFYSKENVSYTDKNVEAGNTYSYRIKSKNDAPYESSFSKAVSVYCITAPKFKAAVTRCEKAVINWEADSKATSFVIYRKEGTSAYSKLASLGKVYTYTDKKVTKGKKYTYKIVAVSDGNGKNTSTEKTYTIGGHTYKETVKPATSKTSGSISYKCKYCSATDKEKINPYKKMTIEKTEYIYSGTAIKPRVKVLDSKGNLISSKYYKVKYADNKQIGLATVTVEFSGNYVGSLISNFKIMPDKTEIKGLKTSEGTVTVSVKLAKKADGYEVRYSKHDNFKSSKREAVEGKNAHTILYLQPGKIYYLQVRSYKVVEANGKVVTYYSDWSDLKAIQCK